MEERALETLKSMLTARGIKAENFEQVGNQLDETKMYTFGGVLIVFSEKTRLTPAEFKNIVGFASENNHTAGIIIITLSQPSDSVVEIVRQYISEKENTLVQMFHIGHLSFDISKHEKVPKHKIVTFEQCQKELEKQGKYVSNPKELPRIDSQDPMARWIGARPGDVIEISGLCVTSAENTRYRYCLPNVYKV